MTREREELRSRQSEKDSFAINIKPEETIELKPKPETTRFSIGRVASRVWSYIPTPTSIVTFFGRIKKVASPYITKQNARQIAVSSAANVVLPLLTFYLTTALSENQNSENKDEKHTSDKARAIARMVIPMALISLRFAINGLLRTSIDVKTKENILTRLLAENGSVMSVKEHSDELAGEHLALETISSDVSRVSSLITDTTVDTVGSILDLAAVLCSAYSLVGFRTLFYTSLFSGGVGVSLSVLDKIHGKILEQTNEHSMEFYERIVHIDNNPYSIGALRSTRYELEKLQTELSATQTLNEKAFPWQIARQVCYNIVYISSPLILSSVTGIYPAGINQETINVFASLTTHILGSVNNLSSTWGKSIQESEKSLERLERLIAAIEDAEKFLVSQRPLTLKYNEGGEIKFSNFSLAKPERESCKQKSSAVDLPTKVRRALESDELCVLRDVEVSLQPGKIYQLKANSNAGKSILLKTMSGSWPYASGEVSFPCSKEEIYFIPQHIFVPHKCSLLEAVVYPRKVESLTEQDKQKAADYMDKLGLREELIAKVNDSTNKEDWKSLSHGEQQRIAIIRMLMRETRPKIVFMDEATSNTDYENEKAVYNLIKEILPEATIICIDHSSGKEIQKGFRNIANSELYKVLKASGVTDEEIRETLSKSSFADAIITIDRESKSLVVTENKRKAESVQPSPVPKDRSR
jgi:ABC-type uncharacterized transport system fused permease/ATPase subunit